MYMSASLIHFDLPRDIWQTSSVIPEAADFVALVRY